MPEVRSLPHGTFGAEVVGLDLTEPLSDADNAFILESYLEHHVLALRGHGALAPETILGVSRIFGEDLEPHVFTHFHHPDTPLILVLSNRLNDDGSPQGLADAGTFWHSDVSYKPKPAKATLLYSLEVPEGEGDTLFCNLRAAYEGLPDAMKTRLDGLMAVHNYAHTPRDIFDSGKVAVPPDCRHPVVRTHPETGRKALYINPAYTVRIEGLSDSESEALKQQLYDHCLRDDYRMTYRWKAGDILVWDNASVMHAATTKTLDPSKYRTIWRTIISGGPTH